MSNRTGSFSLVSGRPAGAVTPIRLAAISSPFNAADDAGGGFNLYADDGRGGSGSHWTIYPAMAGVPMTTPSLVEWTTPASTTLLAAAAHSIDDPFGFSGQVELFAPPPSGTAVGAHAGAWHPVGAPTTGHPGDDWLTNSTPALIAGSYGPHGSLELCLAVRAGGFRHLYADATDPWHVTSSHRASAWMTSGTFAAARHFDGIALAEDCFSNRLLLIGVAGTEVVAMVRDSGLTWHDAVSVWAPPGASTLVGVPALWQEQLPPQLTATGISSQPGDFLIGVGISDGSVQLLRLPYASLDTPAVTSAAPVLPALLWPSLSQLAPGEPVPPDQTPIQIDALSLSQSPSADYPSVVSEFATRPVELYCSYGPGPFNASWFVLGDSGWSDPNFIPSGVIPFIPGH